MEDSIDTLRKAVAFYNCVDEHINTRFKTTAHLLKIYQFCRDAECGINDVSNEAFINLIGYNPTKYSS
jgi:hypothetical protein